MARKPASPQPGGTYMMETSDGRTIIFTFVNVGHYRVGGRDIRTSTYSDLASPYTVAAGPFEYPG
ncbi:hypothetical protein [Caballeronia sordidicola]|uniref:hypothetical protein n=1 Tax=Caballeronia sordidicola TaxID=196367 RepID=UPI000AF64305|nr:hypothetical protein [Caballeronia sordidicola]